jgi:hypothetical protein
LMRCASWAWKESWANGSIPSTSLASDQATGSSTARTGSRSSSLAVTSRVRRGWIHCSWALLEERTHLRCEGEETDSFRESGTRLFPALKALQITRCPFKNLPEKRASGWGESLTAEKMDQCRWVKPKLVCQVALVEWTDAGHLRPCTFVAIRGDKKAAEVVRET